MKALKVGLKALVFVVVMLAVVYGSYSFMTGSRFRVHNINIEMERGASSPFLFSKIKESLDSRLFSLLGQYVWQVDLEGVLKLVESDMRVKEAKVARLLPGTIRVLISPHTPVANIMGARAGRLYPVAHDGEILPPVEPSEAPDSPILRGEIFLKEKERLLSALDMLRALPETGSLSQRTVSEVHFHKKKGYSVIVHPHGLHVWMGFEDFQHRAQQAQRVMDYLPPDQLSGRIIDARFSKKVVVRLRNEP